MPNDIFRHTDDATTFPAGTLIFSEGESSNGLMYVLQEGEVDIFVRDEHIDTIGPGECLGEIALVDNGPRTATAVAKGECKLVPIDTEGFKYLVQQTPAFALVVMRTMAARLRIDRDL